MLWNIVLKILHVYCASDFLSVAQWKFFSVSVFVLCEAETSLLKEPGTFGEIFNDVLQ